MHSVCNDISLHLVIVIPVIPLVFRTTISICYTFNIWNIRKLECPQIVWYLCWLGPIVTSISRKNGRHFAKNISQNLSWINIIVFFISCDQAALRTLLSVRPSVRPSVCHTFLPEASFGLRVLSSPLSVYLSVCVCINHLLVRTITHQPFKLESPNLKHRCKNLG